MEGNQLETKHLGDNRVSPLYGLPDVHHDDYGTAQYTKQYMRLPQGQALQDLCIYLDAPTGGIAKISGRWAKVVSGSIGL